MEGLCWKLLPLLCWLLSVRTSSHFFYPSLSCFCFFLPMYSVKNTDGPTHLSRPLEEPPKCTFHHEPLLPSNLILPNPDLPFSSSALVPPFINLQEFLHHFKNKVQTFFRGTACHRNGGHYFSSCFLGSPCQSPQQVHVSWTDTILPTSVSQWWGKRKGQIVH